MEDKDFDYKKIEQEEKQSYITQPFLRKRFLKSKQVNFKQTKSTLLKQ